MEANQRKTVATAMIAAAIVLFVIYFVRPFFDWATWNEAKGTLDLGIIKVTTRPPFPSDGRSVGLGLIVPIALAAAGFVIGQSRKS